MKEHQLIIEGSTRSLCEHLTALHTESGNIFFARFFCKEPSRQSELIRKFLPKPLLCKVSVIGQKPLSGAECALWIWLTDKKPSAAYEHHFLTNLTASGNDSEKQMSAIFRNLECNLREKGLGTAEDCVRTWIFVRDIDSNYAGAVKGRRDWFEEIGLTSKTHYIASTGIQGDSPDADKTVQMDAYCIKGLGKGQQSYLYAKTHLNPTYEYGVTFERGAAVTYGDRRHIFISGTASIDNKGEVLFVGDPAAQAERMLENIDMLLREAGAGLKDVTAALVYLRNEQELEPIRKVFGQICPWIKAVFLKAPVCRPTWLVETECIVSIPWSTDLYADF